MKLHITKAGPQASIQDMGRPDHRSSGVPLSGAADQLSHQLANFLAGNPATAATIEVTWGNWEATVLESGWLCVAGAGAGALINLEPARIGRLWWLEAGDTLSLPAKKEGFRCYVATPGGWSTPLVLGSRSTCLAAGFGGKEGRLLQAGDHVEHDPDQDHPLLHLTGRPKWSSPWFVEPTAFWENRVAGNLRYLQGPEWDWWNEYSQTGWMAAPWTVDSRSNRMGLRLKGDASFPPDREENMWSAPVEAGTVQVPPDGMPIILMADCQTTGGYPRIAQVAAVDLPKAAQLRPGETVRWEYIAPEQAERLLIKREQELAGLKRALRQQLQYVPGRS